MLVPTGLILIGIALLVLGGEALLRGAVGLATLLRLTPAVIGLTVVAAGTSVPELAVSGVAAWQGQTEIAVANVIGSNIFNIGVILGLCAIIRPFLITGNTITLEYPVLLLVTALCVVVAQDQEISRIEATFLILAYIAFTAYLIRLVRHQVTAAEHQGLKTEVAELTPGDKPKAGVSLLLLAVGVVLLGGGAQATVVGASQLARLLGLSERVIGLTIVSCGTGLPEVVASLVSSIRGRSDVAIGNVIGSNLFNILMILGLSGLFAPLPVSEELLTWDSRWMLGITLLLLPILLTGRGVHRWEGGLLLVTYGVYLCLLL
ncbi:MAG: calcium/sodium antiporter [Aureliella sp.]